MELSIEENDADFYLSLEDELESIDRLMEQANDFLQNFNTPPANSTVRADEINDILYQDSSTSIVNISESLQETQPSFTQRPPAVPQNHTENQSIVYNDNGDDDVVCVGIQHPTVIDYIDLCSPNIHNPPQQSRKCDIKRRRYSKATNNPVTEGIHKSLVEEPEEKRAKDITCRICLESLFDRVTMSTSCGHIFCKICLDQVLKTQKKCPLCNKPLQRNRVFRIYL